MSRRILDIDGARWEVSPSGRVTQYTRDEFGLLFGKGTGTDREERVVRYSPLGSRSPEASLNELSDFQLAELFRRSQPSWTSPETGYRR
jgi:YD repeat-containing protein